MPRKKSYYILWISFPFTEWQGVHEIEERLEEIVGTERNGSGAGFGLRDIDFYFTNRRKAQAALDRIKASDLAETITSMQISQYKRD